MNYHVHVLILLFCCVSHSTRGMEQSPKNQRPARVIRRVKSPMRPGDLKKDGRIESRDDLYTALRSPNNTPPAAPKITRKPSGELLLAVAAESHSNKPSRPSALKKDGRVESKTDLDIPRIERPRTNTTADLFARIITRRPSVGVALPLLHDAEEAIKTHKPETLKSCYGVNPGIDANALLYLVTKQLTQEEPDHFNENAACALIILRDLNPSSTMIKKSIDKITMKCKELQRKDPDLSKRYGSDVLETLKVCHIQRILEEMSENSRKSLRLPHNKQ